MVYANLRSSCLLGFFLVFFLTCFVPCFGVFLVDSERVSTCWSGSEKNHVLVNICLIPFKNVLLQQSAYYLKVVSTIFLLLCSLSLKESICETRKNVFYFNSKALFRSGENQSLEL